MQEAKVTERPGSLGKPSHKRKAKKHRNVWWFPFFKWPYMKANLESGCSKVPRDIHAGLSVATSSTTGSGDIGSPENKMELQ